MRLNGNCWLKDDKEGDNSITARQYICCIFNVTSGGSTSGDSVDVQKKIRRRYSPKSLSTVKRLSIAQVLLGSLMILCQLAPFYWQVQLQSNKDVRIYPILPDVVLPGVWSGAFIMATGILGIVGANKNARCLIIAHLVMNGFALLFALNIAIMASFSMYLLVECKMDGHSTNIRFNHHNRYDSYDYYKYGYDTTSVRPAKVYYFLGEELSNRGQTTFYCSHPLFTAWMVLESVMIASGLAVLGLTIHLLVKNSKALFGCCRACCTLEDGKDDVDEPLIVA